MGVGRVGGCSEEVCVVWKTWIWGSCQTDSVFPEGVSPFLVGAHFCLPRAGENLPLKTAFLAFGPSLEKLTQTEPSQCLLRCVQAGAESGREETIKDHALFTA